MTTTEGNSKRRGRAKGTTDLGRSILRREREKLVKEQAELAEKLAAEAKANRRAAVQQTGQRAQVVKADAAIQRSVVRRVGAVLSSEDVNVPLFVSPLRDDQSISAWTDFEKICVGYHTFDDPRVTAAVLRGLFYHEGGHCRFTVPMLTLEQMVASKHNMSVLELRETWAPDMPHLELHKAWNSLEDQRMETAVVSDSPRKAGYFVPMVLSELCASVNEAAANWPLFVWRRYLPDSVVKGARHLFVVKHGAKGEQVAREVEQVVTAYVTATDAETMYRAIVEMAYLFRQIQPPTVNLSDMGHTRQRNVRRTVDDDTLIIPISPDMLQDGPTGAVEDETDEQDDAIDPEHLVEVLYGLFWYPQYMLKVAYGIPTPADSKDGDSNGLPSPAASNNDEPEHDEQDDEQDDDEQDDEPSTTPEPSRPQAQDDPEDEADDDDNEQDDHGDHGGTTGTHNDDEPEDEASGLSDDDLQQALEDAEQERDQDPALDGDVESYNNVLDGTASTLPVYTSGTDTNPGALQEADNLADGLVTAFGAATVQNMPTWHGQQRFGVLDVNRYLGRRPGDTEIFRAYVDNGEPGHDIAVSVLLDYSGSMADNVEALAKTAYACKTACDRLDIPCTVVLWDTGARVLWDADEKADRLPVIKATGGTDPRVALQDMPNHQRGRTKHLVLIMTDDEWGRDIMLTPYLTENRVIVGLGYNEYGPHQSMADGMQRRGCKYAYAISDLSTIPGYLREALVEMVV